MSDYEEGVQAAKQWLREAKEEGMREVAERFAVSLAKALKERFFSRESALTIFTDAAGSSDALSLEEP